MIITETKIKTIIKEELGKMIANRPVSEMNDLDYYGKYGSPEQSTQSSIDAAIDQLMELIREIEGYYDPDKTVSPEDIVRALTDIISELEDA